MMKMRNSILLGLLPAINDSYRLGSEEAFHLAGWNTGNLAFSYASFTHLGPGVRVVGWKTRPEELNQIKDPILVSCANQLGSHTNMTELGKNLENVAAPISAIGLGAQAPSWDSQPEIPEGTLHWYDVVASRAMSSFPNVGVRGDYTLHVLERIGRSKNAVPLGCPSHFISPDVSLGSRIAKKIQFPIRRIAVAAGAPWVKDRIKLEQSLANMVSLTGGVYIAQMTHELAMLARFEFESLHPNRVELFRNAIQPKLSIPEFLTWCRHYMRVFFNVPAWMEYLRGFDFVIGARIHGINLALQAGVPALCITTDTRTEELCRMMRVPSVPFTEVRAGMDIEDIERIFQFDAGDYDSTRLRLARDSAEFHRKNGLPVEGPLKLLTAV